MRAREGIRPVLWLGCALFALAGCDERQFFVPDDVGVLVVDAIMVVDRPFPRVLLSRTLAPEEAFFLESARESRAEVTIETEGLTIGYVEKPLTGIYLPTSAAVVAPGQSYTLRVRTEAGEVLTSSTTTPARFDVNDWLLLENDANSVRRRLVTYDEAGSGIYDAPENQLVYSDGLLEARFNPGNAFGYQVALFSLDPDSDFVIDPPFFEDEDFEDLERKNSSPMFLGEEGFVRLPWFAIFFEGRYQIKVWSVDRNWDELVRSSPTLNQGLGFGGNAGDGFERPIFNVEGGFGLFGSASVDSVGFRILPPTARGD